MAEQAQAERMLAEPRPAPLALGPIEWLRANLFNDFQDLMRHGFNLRRLYARDH